MIHQAKLEAFRKLSGVVIVGVSVDCWDARRPGIAVKKTRGGEVALIRLNPRSDPMDWQASKVVTRLAGDGWCVDRDALSEPLWRAVLDAIDAALAIPEASAEIASEPERRRVRSAPTRW